MLFFCSYASADVYVVYDKDTDEVVSISNEDDCVVQDNMKMKIIKDQHLSDVVITMSPIYYKLQGNKLVPNLPKISAKESADVEEYEKALEKEKIDKRMIKIAQDSLIAEGEKFNYEHGGE